jgi:hypothetical protein
VVESGVQLAKIAALGPHSYVLEDGSELPKTNEPHADKGGEVLEGMSAESCKSLRDAMILASSARAGGLGAV